MLSYDEKISAIRLINTEAIGPVGFKKLYFKYRSYKKAIEAVEIIWKRKNLFIFPAESAKNELEKAETASIEILFFGEADFPISLAEVKDAPPIIYVKGNKLALQNKAIGIVGSRNASITNCKFTFDISKALAERKITVISGLALGIDAEAHKGALASEFSFATVAVLAGGVDDIYPLKNKNIYQSILENRGAIVSENLIGTSPKAQNFPRRNRIISALSTGVCVMEANLKSGSLITAKYAYDQGKIIFAVPASPLNPQANGTNMLLKNGATMLTCVDDIFENINKKTSGDLFSGISENDLDFFNNADDFSLENEDLILSKIGEMPVEIQVLSKECKLSIQEISSILLVLEIDGKVKSIENNSYVRLF